MSASSLSERLQSVRKRRGFTQRELAQLSGVSLSLIRKLEQGEREDTRAETLRKLAIALRVTTSELMIPVTARVPAPGDGDRWGPVRDALLGRGVLDLEEPPTVQGVCEAMGAAVPLLVNHQYADLGAALPPLLRDARALGREGRMVEARVLHLTGSLMVQTRQFDAADVALTRAVDIAPDRLEAAAAINTRCWSLIRQGQFQSSLDLATKWADDIEPRFSRAMLSELAAWGGLMLRVSTSAVRNNQPGEADDALKLAHAAGVAMGCEYAPPSDYSRTFGPIKVAMLRAENALIEDKPDRVLAIADRIPAKVLRPQGASRHRHRLDVASAHVRLKQYGDAFETLQNIRRISPEWIVNQRFAQDILGEVVQGRRTLTTEMRTLADFMRLEY